MVRAELLGQHSHKATDGTWVHIWLRDGTYLARGSYEGQRFGETLGDSEVEAAAKLRRLLAEIDEGRFIRSSERRTRRVQRRLPPRLSMREICDAFLAEKRKTVGKATTDDYYARLVPLIEFSERREIRRRWPLVVDIDGQREFAVEFRAFVSRRMVARNGHHAATRHTISASYQNTVLETARTALEWARRPDVNLLPASFLNPLTQDIVGGKPRKDPLRPARLPMDLRAKLSRAMDTWQVCHLALSLVLPLRPDDFSGLLISEVNIEKCELQLGTRFRGRDSNKGRHAFICPFPRQLRPLLEHCIGPRTAGPLLRSRGVFDGKRRPKLHPLTRDDVTCFVERALADATAREIQAAQDQKRIIRRTIRAMGGVSKDELSREIKRLLELNPSASGAVAYDLKGSILTEMRRAGVDDFVVRYVTGWELPDVPAAYFSLNPRAEMNKYFRTIGDLLHALLDRAAELGVPVGGRVLDEQQLPQEGMAVQFVAQNSVGRRLEADGEAGAQMVSQRCTFRPDRRQRVIWEL